MWAHLLTFVIPGVMISVPFLANEVVKRTENMGKQLALGSGKSSAENALAETAQVKAAEQRDYFEEGKQRFIAGVRSLEKRALENETHDIYGYIYGLIRELQSLDAKLRLIGVEQQARLTYTKYAPLISKIAELTAPNYYGDFVRNPDHWSDVERKRAQVERSVLALAREVTGDIRRLNSSQELNFQVSVESIIGKATEADENSESEDSLNELLESSGGIQSLNGDLNSLKEAVFTEAAALALSQEEEKRAVERKLKAEIEAKKFRAGSKSSIELKAEEQSVVRPKVISKELLKQSFTIYGPTATSKNYLVSHINSVTGENIWKEFSEVYKAAEWVDSTMLKEERKHDFKCNCIYCRVD